ncbi:hypothetical protein BHE74_00033866, partial [Ensete ventricosum]
FRPILTSVKAVFDRGFYGSLFCRSRSRRCVLCVIKGGIMIFAYELLEEHLAKLALVTWNLRFHLRTNSG